MGKDALRLREGREDRLDRLFRCEVKTADGEVRQVTGLASTEAVDTDGEVVSLAALKAALPAYMKNPVILAAHTRRTNTGTSPVVGKVVAAKVDRRGLWITVEFAGTALGQEYWELYRDKFQRAFSIGFRGLKHHQEMRDGERVVVFDEIMLYEISCVAVPANPEALSKSRQRRQEFVAAVRGRRGSWKTKANAGELTGWADAVVCGGFRADSNRYAGMSEDEREAAFTPAEREILDDDAAASDAYAKAVLGIKADGMRDEFDLGDGGDDDGSDFDLGDFGGVEKYAGEAAGDVECFARLVRA